MNHADLIIDRRTRPTFVERRDDENLMPAGGPRGAQIVRGRSGRRDEDDRARVWPVAAPWMQSSQGPQPTPTGPYRMPSGQLISF